MFPLHIRAVPNKKARKVRPAPAAAHRHDLPQKKSGQESCLSPRRKWAYRLLFLLLTPLLALSIAEGLLWLAGYGLATHFFIPSEKPGRYVSNDKFAQQYFNRRATSRPSLLDIPAQKPPGSIRIFVLGESAAMGTPDPAFSFSRILEVLLSRQYPEQTFEVINAAMRGIDSHIVRDIARDCAEFDPDLFIVYMGNNEMVGLHSPTPRTPAPALNPHLIRLSQACKSSRLGQFVRWKILGLDRAQMQKQDMEFFRQNRMRADDPRCEAVRRNFKLNLEEICNLGRKSRGVLLATLPANLKDFPPLGSLHRSPWTDTEQAQWEKLCQTAGAFEQTSNFTAAIPSLLEATRLDATYAETQFRLARAWLAAGDHVRARHHFQLARDLDAIAFRPPSTLNSIIRQVAGQRPHTKLVDLEKAFAESHLAEVGLPGGKLFYDHVHPTFEGNYIAARAFLQTIESTLAGVLKRRPDSPPLPDVAECASALAYTSWAEFNVREAMLQMMSNPPFLDQWEHEQLMAAAEIDLKARRAAITREVVQQTISLNLEILSRNPTDWKSRFNLAFYYRQIGQPALAAQHLQELVQEYPRHAPFYAALSATLTEAGQINEAHICAMEAAKLDPGLALPQPKPLQFSRRD